MEDFNYQGTMELSPLGQSDIEVFAKSLILSAMKQGQVVGIFNEVKFTVVAGDNSTADDLVRNYYAQAKLKTMRH